MRQFEMTYAIKGIVLLATMAVLAAIVNAQDRDLDWFSKLRQIKPGITKMQDLEQIFDKWNIQSRPEPKGGWENYVSSEGKGVIDVVYSSGSALVEYPEIGVFDRGTVEYAYFWPSEMPKVETLISDESKLEVIKDPMNRGTNYLVDKDAGLRFLVNSKHLIGWVQIFHPDWYSEIIQHSPTTN